VAASPNQRLSYGAIAAIGGGALLIISLFIDWVGSGGFGANAFDLFSLDDIILLVLGLMAIGLGLMELPAVNVNLPVSRQRALVTVGIVATTMVWSFLVEGSSLKFGIFLAGLSAIAILAGGILMERAPHLGIALGGGAPAYGGPGIGQGGYGQPPGGYAQQPPAYAQPPAAAAPAPGAADAPTAFEQPVAQASPPPPDTPGAPADWYPDPKGEKRLRYWDGAQWTDHVAD
jgi:Protein of unknown function (DUF2510)